MDSSIAEINERLAEAEVQLAKERATLQRLEAVLAAEGRDVRQLEGLSLRGLFVAVLGDKQAQLEKERQEFLAAKLNRDRCLYGVGSLEKEVERLRSALTPLEGVESEYRSIIDAKARLVGKKGDERSRPFFEASEALAVQQAEVKEIREAQEAGDALRGAVNDMVRTLRSARGWGVFDMVGGGLLATAVKHEKINRARGQLNRVEALLAKFKRELGDIQAGGGHLATTLSGFETFADFFFDNLIIDWIVQSKIVHSLGKAEELELRVAAMLTGLATRRQEQEQAVEKSRQTIQEMLDQL